jgi:DNA-binding response OmpR family regulator
MPSSDISAWLYRLELSASLVLQAAVVEDEPLIQMLAATQLAELGFDSDVSSTASDAKSKLQLLNDAVSVAIVDVGLPDAKGDDLVRELTAMYASLPIIVASGYDLATLRERLRHLDRIGYLAKPYTLATLKDCLKTLGVIHPGFR